METDTGVGLERRAVLARGSRAERVRIGAGCVLLEVAADWAAINPGDGLMPQDTLLEAATERAMVIAGEGTPTVAEASLAELGLEIRRNPWQAAGLVADALDLQYRLPRTWQLVQQHRVEVERARRLAYRTRMLTPVQADQVDAEIVVSIMVVGRYRLETLIDAAIKTADPEGTRKREEAAARWRGVRLGSQTEDGLVEVLLRVNADAGHAIYAMCDHVADLLIAHRDHLPEGVPDRDAQSKDEWRAVAAEVLKNPFLGARVLIELDQPDLFQDLVDSFGPLPADPRRTPDDRDVDEDPEPRPDSPRDHRDADLEPRPDRPLDHREDAPRRSAAGNGTALNGASDHDRGDRGPDSAEQLSEGSSDQQQRAAIRDAAVRALLRALDPQRLLPRVRLNIHLSQAALQGRHPVARVEELGPQLVSTVREWLRAGVRIDLRPVIDPDGIPAVDSYETPAAMRMALFARSPASVFPYSNSLRGTMDIDHSIPYRPPPIGPPGQTGLHGLGQLNRREHRSRTFGRLAVRQPEPGTFLWRTQTGRVIVANPAGTLDLGNDRLARTLWDACRQPTALETVVHNIVRKHPVPTHGSG